MTFIRVRQLNQRIELDPGTHRINVVLTGPQGPAGPPGTPGGGGGGGGSAFEHVQASPNASWVIDHNLGYRPNYNVEDESGVDLSPAHIHHSIYQLELQFNTPRAGTAYLS